MIEGKKMKLALIIAEASLLPLEVFVELHTVCQFEKDSGPTEYHTAKTASSQESWQEDYRIDLVTTKVYMMR